jgi:DNA-binding transcriptional LysR family regulator
MKAEFPVIFSALARTLNFRDAAQELGMNHVTLMRRLDEFEAKTGTKLFVRHNQGLKMTTAGRRLVAVTSDLDKTMDRFWTATKGLAHQTTVTIMGTDGMASFWLPHALEGFHEKNPGITVEVSISEFGSSTDVRTGGADIEITYSPPTENDAVVIWHGIVPIRLYAARKYAELHSLPTTFEELRTHRLCMFENPGSVNNPGLAALEEIASTGRVAWRTRSTMGLGYAIQSGAGIGPMTKIFPNYNPAFDVVELSEDIFSSQFPVWLVMHMDTKDNKAPRAVADWFSKNLPEFTAKR